VRELFAKFAADGLFDFPRDSQIAEFNQYHFRRWGVEIESEILEDVLITEAQDAPIDFGSPDERGPEEHGTVWPRTLCRLELFAIDLLIALNEMGDAADRCMSKQSAVDQKREADFFAAHLVSLPSAIENLAHAVDRLIDELSAVAFDIAEFGRCVAPNVNSLLCRLAAVKYEQVRSSVRHAAYPREVDLPGLSKAVGNDYRSAPWLSGLFVELSEEDVKGHFEAALEGWQQSPTLERLDIDRLDVRAYQERCRAADRRLVTGRQFREDGADEGSDSNSTHLTDDFDDLKPPLAANCQDRSQPKRDEKTEARDKWIYEQCHALKPYDQIVRELKEHSEWDLIIRATGIIAAAKRYADRHGLPEIPKRQSGRPPKRVKRPEI
jgi:hypothetical protein